MSDGNARETKNQGREGASYTTNDFTLWNSYIDGLVRRDRIYTVFRGLEVTRLRLFIAAIAAVSICICIFLLALAFGKQRSDGEESRNQQVVYVPVPDPTLSRVVEKQVIVEKPVYIPIDVPDQAGVLTNFSLFRTVEVVADGVRVVVTGSEFDSIESRYPSKEWCYANGEKIVGNTAVRIDLGNREAQGPITWARITAADAGRVGITVPTFERIKEHCLFGSERVADENSETVVPPDEDTTAKLSSGTAFVVNRTGQMLTNHHVVDQCITLHVRDDEEFFVVRLIATDEERDLAIIEANDERFKTHVYFASAVSTGEQAVALGFPLGLALGKSLKVTSGIISSLEGVAGDTRMMQFTAPIQPGNSGGPLLNKYGQVIGVNTAAIIDEKVQNVNLSVKGSVAQEFLSSSRIDYQAVEQGKVLEIPDMVSQAEQSVFQVVCTRQQ